MRLISLFVLVALIGCSDEPEPEPTPSPTTEPTASDVGQVDYTNVPTYSEDGRVNAIIEIPAGTNDKIEYIPERDQFEVTRTVNYMPYPGNYGFIPGTFMDPADGGDGDAMDVLVLAPYQPTGTIMEIVVIGALELTDHGEVDNKLIAVPADPEQNLLGCWNLSDLPMEVMLQIENWFSNYKGEGIVEFVGWQKEDVALQSIQYWME